MNGMIFQLASNLRINSRLSYQHKVNSRHHLELMLRCKQFITNKKLSLTRTSRISNSFNQLGAVQAKGRSIRSSK